MTKQYVAFISYSHRDTAWGDWLHKSLETYKVPSSLRGTKNKDGELIPSKLTPIFRDRDELPTRSDLGDVIHSALKDSHYLIIICSPNAAQSMWVDNEIIEFKKMYGESKVLAIVVDGEPNATDKPHFFDITEEAFPHSLKYKVNSFGNVTSERTEPLAADARKIGDGKERAKIKLIAGLIGVGFDDLWQREKRRKRLTLLINTIIIMIFFGLLAYAFIQYKEIALQNKLSAQTLAQSGYKELQRKNCNKAYKNYSDSLKKYPLMQSLLGEHISSECKIDSIETTTPINCTVTHFINVNNDFLTVCDNRELQLLKYDQNKNITQVVANTTISNTIFNISYDGNSSIILSTKDDSIWPDTHIYRCDTNTLKCKDVIKIDNIVNAKVFPLNADDYLVLGKETEFGHSILTRVSTKKTNLIQKDIFSQPNYTDVTIIDDQTIATISGNMLQIRSAITLDIKKEIELFDYGFSNLLYVDGRLLLTFENDLYYLHINDLVLRKTVTYHQNKITSLQIGKKKNIVSKDADGMINIRNNGLNLIATLSVNPESKTLPLKQENKIVVLDKNHDMKLFDFQKIYDKFQNKSHLFRHSPFGGDQKGTYYFEKDRFINHETNESFVPLLDIYNDYVDEILIFFTNLMFSHHDDVVLLKGYYKESSSLRHSKIFSYLYNLKTRHCYYDVTSRINSKYVSLHEAFHPFQNDIITSDSNSVYLIKNYLSDNNVTKIHTYQENNKINDISYSNDGKHIAVLMNNNELLFYNQNGEIFSKMYIGKFENKLAMQYIANNNSQTYISSIQSHNYPLINNFSFVKYAPDLILFNIQDSGIILFDMKTGSIQTIEDKSIMNSSILNTIKFKQYIIFMQKSFKEYFYMYDIKQNSMIEEFKSLTKNAVSVAIDNDTLRIQNHNGTDESIALKDFK